MPTEQGRQSLNVAEAIHTEVMEAYGLLITGLLVRFQRGACSTRTTYANSTGSHKIVFAISLPFLRRLKQPFRWDRG